MEHGSNIQHNTLEDVSIKHRAKTLDEEGFVTLFKDLFGINSQDKFPNDFDAWTVQKQCDWINQNIATFFPNAPQSLLNFIPAAFCPLRYYDRPLEELPDWMDIDKYRRGQKFIKKHYTALVISKIMGLMYFFAFHEGVKPIIFGGRRHTPYLGFQKYVSLIKRVTSWYNGDPWVKGTEAYKSMHATRNTHLVIRKKLCQMDHERLDAVCTFANPWSLDRELLLKDFVAASPPEKFGQRPYQIHEKSLHKPKGMNNADLASVQSCFVVIPLLYPHSIGIYDATDKDLEDFCYMWKCYGYFLGIEDEYNFCRGSLDEIKQRVSDHYRCWIVQNFKELTQEWEHITRCLVVPLNYYPILSMPYKVMTLLATDALKLNMPHLSASLNYTEWITYKIYKFLFYGLRFTIIRIITNKVLHNLIDKAANYDAEKLAEIHETSKKILPDFSLVY